MKLRSAHILQEGKREIRAIGDSCDPSCFTWFACGNSKPNGICKGFILLDGETRKIINENLSENDVIYVENCMRIIQNGSSEETKEQLIQEVLRYIPPPPTRHKEGFLGMLEASRGTVERSAEEEKQEPSNSEFQRMLSESGKNNQPAIERQIIPIEFASQFPDLCDPDKCPPNYARHCRANRQENYGKPCIYVTLKNR